MYRYTITYNDNVYGQSDWLYSTEERCRVEAENWKNAILQVIEDFGNVPDTPMSSEDWVVTIQEAVTC